MQCDVRQCPKEEVVPLFNKMVSKSPKDVCWNSNDCYVTYEIGCAKITYWMRTRGEDTAVSFEFYPGVDNIRFDGWLSDISSISKLEKIIKYGRGQKVSDFFSL